MGSVALTTSPNCIHVSLTLQGQKKKGKVLVVSVAQSCLTFCNPMDCGRPGSSVHEILQARILERIFLSPGIEPGSPALHADSLPSESPGKPRGKSPGAEGSPNGLLAISAGNLVKRSCRSLITDAPLLSEKYSVQIKSTEGGHWVQPALPLCSANGDKSHQMLGKSSVVSRKLTMWVVNTHSYDREGSGL